MFWIVLTPVVCLTLLWGNWGEVRLYVILGLALGAVVYLNILSKYIFPLMDKLVESIKQFICLVIKAIKLMWRLVCWPFKFILMIFSVPLGFVFGIINKLWSLAKRSFNFSIKGKLKNIVNRCKSILRIKKN